MLQIVGRDFAAATRIIPQLHAMLYEEESSSVGSWKKRTALYGSATNIQPSSASESQHTMGSGERESRKRQSCEDMPGLGFQRGDGDIDGDGDPDGDDDAEGNYGRDGDGNRDRDDGRDDGDEDHPSKRAKVQQPHPAYVCHFAKRYPQKYNVHTRRYRICPSGFSSIKTLK